MSEGLATALRIVAALALTAAVVTIAWIALAGESEKVDDPAGQIDYSKFRTQGACEAVGGTWGGEPTACTG